MGFGQNAGNPVGKPVLSQGRPEGGSIHGRGVLTGKPVVGLAEEVVAHFGPRDQVEAGGVGPEAEDFVDVDVAGDVLPLGDVVVPVRQPLRPVDADQFDVKPVGHGGLDVRLGECGDVLVEIRGTRRADAEGVDLGPGEAVAVVELDRRERGAQLHELGRWFVKFAAFVAGADDEDAEVAPRGRFDGRPGEVVDPVPMQIHVIVRVGFNRGGDHAGGRVGGEADPPAAALFFQVVGDFDAAVRPFEDLIVVDAVEGEEVHVIELEFGQRIVEGFEKIFWIGGGGDFGLDDESVAGDGREDLAELDFAGAVAAGGFDVIDAEFEGAANGGFEVALVVGRDLVERGVFPGMLVAHAAAGEDRHGEAGAAESAAGDEVAHGVRSRGAAVIDRRYSGVRG